VELIHYRTISRTLLLRISVRRVTKSLEAPAVPLGLKCSVMCDRFPVSYYAISPLQAEGLLASNIET